MKTARPWSRAEVAYLRQLDHEQSKEVVRLFGLMGWIRTVDAVNEKRHRLGLTRNPDVTAVRVSAAATTNAACRRHVVLVACRNPKLIGDEGHLRKLLEAIRASG